MASRHLAEFSDGFLAEGEACPTPAMRRPEDAIPDLPENAAAREFLRRAPTKGLHMPLGKEVQLMQCWRCKAYGHRTGDKECSMANAHEPERLWREDPMQAAVAAKQEARRRKYERVDELKHLVEEIRQEERERKERKAKRRAASDDGDDGGEEGSERKHRRRSERL